MRTAIIGTVGLLLLSGCTDGLLHSETRPVPDGSWHQAWQPEFNFDVADTLGQYDTYIDIRHTGDYAYSNLLLFVTLKRPNGHAVRDTVEIPLADATGRWLGKGLGFIRSNGAEAHVLYKYNNRFPQTGRYGVVLEQAMRVDPLQGIIDVGMSIEKHNDLGK